MSNKFKKEIATKVAVSFLSLSTALFVSGASFAVPLVANAALTEAQISSILSLLDSFGVDATTRANVNSSLRGQPTTTPAPAAGACGFTRDLTLGSQGDDVKCLQTYLTSTGHYTFSGGSTGYFGNVTKSAAAAWQAANAVSPAAGYFGSISRAKYNSLTGGAVTTPGGTTPPPVVTVPGTGLSVSAGTQPAASLAPQNAVRVPFTVIKLTAASDGDVTVSSVTVERTGLAADTAIAGVTLLDENGGQLGIAKTLNSSHQAAVGEAFTVKAGQTRTMTIAANMDSDLAQEAGQVAYFSVVGINTSATVSGTLPITGAGHTINATLSIGAVTMARGATDPGANQTKEVGTTNYTFSSVKVTAGSAEKIYLRSIRWNQTGSIGSGDLKNMKTYVDGTAYDLTVSSDGKYYTATLPGNGLLIDKGFSKELNIKGDVSGGSGRTVDFDLAKRSDIYIVGETYGYGIMPPQTGASVPTVDTAAFSSSEDPWYDAAQVTVSSGTMNVSVSTAVPAQNIAVNLANQPLGAFTVDVKGEAISVASIHFNVDVAGTDTGSNADVDDITNITLVDANGAVVAGPVDGSATDSANTSGLSDGSISLTDTVTFPIGVNTYTLRGKIGTDIDNNMTVQASTTPSNDFKTVKGQVTGNTVTPTPSSAISLSIMTIKAASTSVSVSSIPIAQTIIAGASQFTFAQYVMDGTASGEDVRLTAVPLSYDLTSGGGATDLTNCRLYDGATAVTTGGNVVNPSATGSSTSFTFDGTGITIPKGVAKTITLKCDVRSGATANGRFAWGIDSGGSFSGFTGLVSGQSVVPTINDSQGQYMTVAAGGTLNVVLDTNSPPYKIVNSGATNVELARLKLSATSEDIDLRQIALQLTGVASNTPDDLVGRKVTLWTADGVQMGEANFPTGDTATSSSIALANFRVPRDGAKVLVIKGDIAGIAVSGPLTRSGDLLAVDYDGGNEGLNGTYGVGVASGATIGDAASEITGDDTASNGVRVMKAYPELAKIDLSTSERILQAVAQKTLYKFSVKATGGDVALYKFSFDVGSSTVSATTSVYGLYAYTDSTFSSEDTTFSATGLLNAGNCVNGKQSTDPNDLIVETYMDKTGCNQATTTYIIGSGQTRWFKFNATVSSVRTTTGSESISMSLLGDAAYSVNASTLMEQASGLDGDTNDDLIWSPISTTTQNGVGDLDFTNGYQVKGLPGTNMTPETLTATI